MLFTLDNETKEKKEPTLFFFTVQRGPLNVSVMEDVHCYLALDDNIALNLVRQRYDQGEPISIRKRGSIPVSRITKFVNDTDIVPVTVVQKQDERSMIYDAMFVADRLVDDPDEKAMMKRIISKTLKKYGESNPPSPESGATETSAQ